MRTSANRRKHKFKGWLQTLVTITRSPFALAREIGLVRSLAVGLLFFGLLFGPLFWVPSIILAAAALFSKGLLSPSDVSGVCLATLWASVSLLGAPSLFWYALLGMRRQGLLHLWPALALLLPYYCLHTAAAWMALYDLFWQPFHWHKTEHGLAAGVRRTREPVREKALA